VGKKNSMKLTKIKNNQKLRQCDPLGCGHFGAPRGSRLHQGIDIITTKGEPIKSPISGKVVREAFPYGNDLSWSGVLISNDIYEVKMFYLVPTIEIGSFVNDGDVIGISQDISEKHGSSMTTHVHVEVRKKGILINPTELF
jgi:murein DD-endopeptidase MepM/ murein hydrolase activator NlpD